MSAFTSIKLVLEALTPIAHADTRTGMDNPTNIRLAMSQAILLNGRRAYVPHVSENALRTLLLRRPLADHLLATLRLDGGLSRAVLSLLYAGGSMGGAGRLAPGEEGKLGHAVGRLYPSLALLGGSVDAMILPRGKLRLTAFLIAEEYAGAVGAIFGEGLAAEARRMSAFDLVGEETRTRGIGFSSDENRMIYNYEVLAAGTRIAVELLLDRWTPPAVAASLAAGLAEWDGYIGGQGRQGRGRCRIVSGDGLPPPGDYAAHISEHAEAMRAGLLDGTLGTGKVICSDDRGGEDGGGRGRASRRAEPTAETTPS